MEKGDLTYRIIGLAMTVHKKLKRGCREYVYCRALAIEMRREGIGFEREVWLPIHYDNLRMALSARMGCGQDAARPGEKEVKAGLYQDLPDN